MRFFLLLTNMLSEKNKQELKNQSDLLTEKEVESISDYLFEIEERSAIIEFCGNYSRSEAERIARIFVNRKYQNESK